MTPNFILIIGIIILLIVFAFILVSGSGKFKQPTPPLSPSEQQLINAANQVSQWSPVVNVPGGQRNTCLTYSFPGTMVGQFGFPGQASLNNDILNSLPAEPAVKCTYPDQIVAKQQEHVCQAQQHGQGFGCISQNGILVPPGTIEVFYVQCTIPTCKGSYTQIVVNFDASNLNNILCLTKTPNGVIIPMQCDIANVDQLFNVVQSLPGGQVSTGAPYAVFKDRDVPSLCIVPGQDHGYGPRLEMGTCAPHNGIVWLLAPSVPLCPPGTQPNCDPTTDGNLCDSTNTGPNVPGIPCGIPTGSGWVATTPYASSSPQQYVYTINSTVAPPQTPFQVFTYLQAGPFAIAPAPDGTVTLQPFATNKATQPMFESQLVDYVLFNTLRSNPTSDFPFGPI
jgi:hypothetical protein